LIHHYFNLPNFHIIINPNRDEIEMAVAEETGGGTTIIDETYEFSAPRFFDFMKGESDDEIRRAELWFHTALSYAPSRK
jgi:hypothetical protein